MYASTGASSFKSAVLRHFAVPGLALLIGSAARSPKAATPRPGPAGKPAATNAADVAKDNQRKTDEFVEASQAINGPAGNPECVWLGRRVVRLMWRDDLDTAFRHLDLYDRFGCPGGHVQATFRCLTRFGGQIDPKVAKTPGRPHPCLLDQSGRPAPDRRGSPPPAATAGNAAPAPAARRPPAPASSGAAGEIVAAFRNVPERSEFSAFMSLKIRALKTPRRHTSC